MPLACISACPLCPWLVPLACPWPVSLSVLPLASVSVCAALGQWLSYPWPLSLCPSLDQCLSALPLASDSVLSLASVSVCPALYQCLCLSVLPLANVYVSPGCCQCIYFHRLPCMSFCLSCPWPLLLFISPTLSVCLSVRPVLGKCLCTKLGLFSCSCLCECPVACLFTHWPVTLSLSLSW